MRIRANYWFVPALAILGILFALMHFYYKPKVSENTLVLDPKEPAPPLPAPMPMVQPAPVAQPLVPAAPSGPAPSPPLATSQPVTPSPTPAPVAQPAPAPGEHARP